jgi:hypothetical protein
MTETKETSIQALQRRAEVITDPAISPGFGTAGGFDLLQRQAKLFAASSLVPSNYRGNVADAVIAVNMAHRIGADPLMVMQNLDIIDGRPSWRAQFMIAAFNQSGRFAPLRYQMLGEPGTDSYGCRAFTVGKDGERIDGPAITVKLAKDQGWWVRKGSKWPSMTEMMLRYRAASWLVRTLAPELTMGIQTRDEIEDAIDVTPDAHGVYRVAELADVSGGKPEPETIVDDQAPVKPSKRKVTVRDERAPEPPPQATESGPWLAAIQHGAGVLEAAAERLGLDLAKLGPESDPATLEALAAAAQEIHGAGGVIE